MLGEIFRSIRNVGRIFKPSAEDSIYDILVELPRISVIAKRSGEITVLHGKSGERDSRETRIIYKIDNGEIYSFQIIFGNFNDLNQYVRRGLISFVKDSDNVFASIIHDEYLMVADAPAYARSDAIGGLRMVLAYGKISERRRSQFTDCQKILTVLRSL